MNFKVSTHLHNHNPTNCPRLSITLSMHHQKEKKDCSILPTVTLSFWLPGWLWADREILFNFVFCSLPFELRRRNYNKIIIQWKLDNISVISRKSNNSVHQYNERGGGGEDSHLPVKSFMSHNGIKIIITHNNPDSGQFLPLFHNHHSTILKLLLLNQEWARQIFSFHYRYQNIDENWI